MAKLSDLQNIGKVLEARLVEAGVDTPETLRELGSREALVRLREADPGACVRELYALEGAPSVRGLSCPFTDAGGSWYTDAVIWAYNAGVVAGVSPTQFAPNEALTREQMVTMLYGYAGREQALSGPDGALAGYKDQARVSTWAREAMAWAVGTGVIAGTSATTLAPQKTGTRAEVATVLMRFCEQ